MKLPIYSVSEKSLYACARTVLHPAGSGGAPHIKYFGWHTWHIRHVVPKPPNAVLSAKYCTFIHVTSTVTPFLLPTGRQGLHAHTVYRSTDKPLARPGWKQLTCNPEEIVPPGLPMSWSPTQFSGSGPFGLPPVPWTEKKNWKGSRSG
jgi:hypothetical protein